MTDHDPTAERDIRGMLAERADEVRPQADLAGVVIAGYRRHRNRTAVGAAVAAAVVAAGVPVGLHAARGDAATGRTPATSSPPAVTCPPGNPRPAPDRGAKLPDQRTARGSLGGDAALVREVLMQGWLGIKLDDQRQPGHPAAGGPPDPRTTRVQLVERVGDLIVGEVYATDTGHTWAANQWVAGRSADTVTGVGGGTEALTGGAADFDRPLGQLFYGEQPVYLDVRSFQCTEYGIAVVPPDSQLTVAGNRTIDSAGHVVAGRRPVPLRDGIAFIKASGMGSGLDLEVRRHGQLLAKRSLPLGTPAEPAWPTADQLEQAIRAGHGQVDGPLVKEAFGPVQYGLRGVQLGRPEVIWGGKAPNGRPLVLVSVVFDSGARYVSDAAALKGGGFGGRGGGILPAGPLDRHVFAFVSADVRALVVVATGGVRAEAVQPDNSVVPIPWHDGGGMLAGADHAKLVRVYDANNRLIEERKPGTGLLDGPNGL